MANTIKHKRGSGSNPSASDLVAGELAIRTDTGVVFTKKDDGTVAQIAGGGDTDLGVTTTSTAVTVTSSTGDNATISEASSSAAGVMSAAHHDKLDGIATGAEVNVATNLSKTTTTTTNVIASSTGTNVTLNEATGSAAGLMSTTHHNKLDGIESNATADQSASEILTAIKTVDGSGTGLDADLLDGVHASSFLRSDAADAKTSGDLTFNDSVKALFGTGSDLEIYHNGTNTFLNNGTGGVFIDNTANDSDISLRTDDGSGGLNYYVNCDGSTGEVKLYYYGAKKLATKSDGIDITGELQCDSLDVDGAADITGTVTLHGNLDLQDSDKILLGAGDDLQIYHDGSHSYIYDSGSGNLKLRTNAFRVNNAADTENIITANQNAEVNLFYDNSNKLQTKSDGVNITGELQCDSLDVDGAANITGNVDINGNIRHNGDTNTYFGFSSNDNFRIVTAGAERFRITSTGAIAIEGSSNYGSSGQVLTSNGNDAPTWQDGGGTVASGCVYENSQTISSNYSVTSGKNAMSAGPITIASGVTVTVTSGSTYTIV